MDCTIYSDSALKHGLLNEMMLHARILSALSGTINQSQADRYESLQAECESRYGTRFELSPYSDTLVSVKSF